MIIDKELVLANERILITNQRAVFWEREQMLIVADVHLGKTAHFRKHGIAIPASVMHEDLKRLQALIVHYNVKNIVVVGDLFHAGHNTDLHFFAAWRASLPGLHVHLIKGNHDRLSLDHYHDLGLDLVSDSLTLAPFHFHHEGETAGNHICISGHIHPGRSISIWGKQSMRLPCYIVNRNQLILPAFSLFTGLDTKTTPEGKNAFYVFTEKEIFAL